MYSFVYNNFNVRLANMSSLHLVLSCGILPSPVKQRCSHISQADEGRASFVLSYTVEPCVHSNTLMVPESYFGQSFLFFQRVVLGGVRQVTLYQGIIPSGMPGAQHFLRLELAALCYSSSHLTDVARET